MFLYQRLINGSLPWKARRVGSQISAMPMGSRTCLAGISRCWMSKVAAAAAKSRRSVRCQLNKNCRSNKPFMKCVESFHEDWWNIFPLIIKHVLLKNILHFYRSFTTFHRFSSFPRLMITGNYNRPPLAERLPGPGLRTREDFHCLRAQAIEVAVLHAKNMQKTIGIGKWLIFRSFSNSYVFFACFFRNDGKIHEMMGKSHSWGFFLRKILEPVLFGIFRPTMFGDRRAFAKSPPPGVPIPSHCASCLIGVPTIGNSHHPPI